MPLFLASIFAFIAAGILSALPRKRPRAAGLAGAGGAVLGSLLGIASAVKTLASGAGETLHLSWTIPYAAVSFQLEPLSSFFLLLVFAVGLVTAIYGQGYLRHHHPGGAAHTWLFFNIMVASIAVVFAAGNAILFLMAWEIMALSSFFLVILEGEKESTRRAGLIYLVVTQAGTALLLVFFILLGNHAGSFDFSRLASAASLPMPLANALFILALVGFGSKAGFVPLHVWLPEAHPAAPSHVSALMSGIMIKTGIYGLFRALTFLGPPPSWWGWALIAVGFVTSCWAILFASAQRDLKRLLAYSSVENIGIIALALGVALFGESAGLPVLTMLGATAALFHVLNHAAYKTLLFLGAGGVSIAAGTLDLDRLGGLLKKAPWLGAGFLVGALAICGLPPLNGLASEFLLYLGALRAGISQHGFVQQAPLGLAIGSLAICGGLAIASFSKAFGIVFLGTCRGNGSEHWHAPGLAIQAPVVVLGFVCVALGLLAPFVASGIASIVQTHGPFKGALAAFDPAPSLRPLFWLAGANAGALIAIALAVWLRRALLRGRNPGRAPTWDCGYSSPTPRMQYSSSSLVQPIAWLFGAFLRPREKDPQVVGYFPHHAEHATETPDFFLERVFSRVFTSVDGVLSRLRRFQHGRLQAYVFYILVTLVALLLWHLEVVR
ncbi:MAG: hypothetical protein HYW49_10380 [Deltaproteobacteria bacterium]|nr:hypothetical protein [Deltaproteobacteria bacterium]